MGIAGTVVYVTFDLDAKSTAPVAIFSTALLAENFMKRNEGFALYYSPMRIDAIPLNFK